MSRFLLATFVSLTALAQNSIEGTVLNDRTGLPLKRAHVVLRPQKANASAAGIDTDDKGAFSFHDLEAGRYSLSASRDGFLASSVCSVGSVRLPQIFNIGATETIAGLTFRLQPFAVMAGKVSFEDGEPAMSIRVEAYREYRNLLRHGYQLAASATTDDRGQYRMFGLEPGSYIVAAREPSAAPNEQVHESLRYATTYFMNATRLSQAARVKLDYGQEVGGIDVFLSRVRKVTLRGRVLSGFTGEPVAGATLAMQSVDARNTASIAVTVPAVFDRDKRFEIRDVTPGAYVLWAQASDAGQALVGHEPLTVGESDIDTLDVTIFGERPGAAVLAVEGGVKLAQPVQLRLEPRNERGKVVEASEEMDTESFHFSLMGDDRYDLFVTNLTDDFYLSAVRVNGVDMMALGIEGTAASLTRPLELVLDSRGARISGRVLGSDDSLWSRASIALIPDPPAGRVQSYREGAADENGIFQFHGVAPGKYVLLAWLDTPPCDYYDPDALPTCRAAGQSVEVQQSGEQNVELKMKR